MKQRAISLGGCAPSSSRLDPIAAAAAAAAAVAAAAAAAVQVEDCQGEVGASRAARVPSASARWTDGPVDGGGVAGGPPVFFPQYFGESAQGTGEGAPTQRTSM